MFPKYKDLNERIQTIFDIADRHWSIWMEDKFYVRLCNRGFDSAYPQPKMPRDGSSLMGFEMAVNNLLGDLLRWEVSLP